MRYKHLISTRWTVVIALIVSELSSCAPKAESWEVASPDGTTVVAIFQTTDENTDSTKLCYRISYKDSIIIENGALGIQSSEADFRANLSFVNATESVIDENYSLIAGNKKQGHNYANELVLNFKNKDKKQEDSGNISLRFRAYNNGIAFQYLMNNPEQKTVQVLKELTNFSVTGNSKTWIQPYNPSNSQTVGYEAYYSNGVSVDSLKMEQNGWSYAALFEQNKHWLFVTEASLNGTSPASHLIRTDSSNISNSNSVSNKTFALAYPLPGESLGQETNLPNFNTKTWESPWRVFLVTDTALANIVESEVITSLNAKSTLKNTDWIKPGLASWSWCIAPESPKSYPALVNFIDFAASHKIPYFLVDANWNLMQGGNIEQLISYANSKNVGIWLWYNSGGKHNTVTEQPRDLMDVDSLRKKEFARIHALGVKGVKIDFFLSDKQHIIKQYVDILNDAAEAKLMANFHGCTLPRGWNRTYPNLMAMESVRGGEYYLYDSIFPKATVWHNTVLPFTRNLTGPMDYTSFGLSNNIQKHITTFSNELAQLLVFTAGVNHIVDTPEKYLQQPDYVQSFLQNYPTKPWDDFKFISGYPGKEIVMARKVDNKWYIAGLNGEATLKNLKVSLKFLQPNQKYHLRIIADGKTSDTFSYKETIISSDEELTISTLPNGGFVALLELF